MNINIILSLFLIVLLATTAACEKVTIFTGTAKHLSLNNDTPRVGLHNGTLWEYFTVDAEQYQEIVIGEMYRFTEIQFPNGEKTCVFKVIK